MNSFDGKSRVSEGSPRFLPAAAAAAATCVILVLATLAYARPNIAPRLTVRPNVAGTPTLGTRIFVSRGTWSAAGPLAFAYTWYRCDTMGSHCAVLNGVDKKSHRLGAHDVGHTISVVVHAFGAKGSATAFSGLVGPVSGSNPRLGVSVMPAISGAAVPGSTLHVDTGRWHPVPTRFDYQWVRCHADLRACVPIAGATSDSHPVAVADLGHVLAAIVQGHVGVTSRAVFGEPSAIVAAAEAAAGAGSGPTSVSAPALAEVAQQGNVLTAAAGSWSGSGVISFAYQWYRCDPAGAHCKSIHGATAQTYREVAKDVGQTLGLAVRATDTTGTATAYVGLVGPVAAADGLASTVQPTVTGTPAPEQVLQVSNGSWNQPPASFAYQWQRCNPNGRLCVPIEGATAVGYTVTAADAGHSLLATVHAVAGATGQDTLSQHTRVVPAAQLGPVATVAPAVTGVVLGGSHLTAAAGSWSGSGVISFAYQWYRCDPAGAHCKSIHGATAQTYREVAKDVGQTLGLAVRATDTTGTATAYVGLVGPVAAADGLASTVQPTVTGTPAPEQVLQVSNGSWNQPPASFAYQWQRCNPNGRLCVPIEGATAVGYTVTAADAGHSLLATVHAVAGATGQDTLSMHTAPLP